jgi:hypothetical protein
MQRIATMNDLHKALGGTPKLAKQLKSGRSAVGMWTTNGAVSGGHRLTVYMTLRELGYTPEQINPELFDYESWADAVLPMARIRKIPSRLRSAA